MHFTNILINFLNALIYQQEDAPEEEEEEEEEDLVVCSNVWFVYHDGTPNPIPHTSFPSGR